MTQHYIYLKIVNINKNRWTLLFWARAGQGSLLMGKPEAIIKLRLLYAKFVINFYINSCRVLWYTRNSYECFTHYNSCSCKNIEKKYPPNIQKEFLPALEFGRIFLFPFFQIILLYLLLKLKLKFQEVLIYHYN